MSAPPAAPSSRSLAAKRRDIQAAIDAVTSVVRGHPGAVRLLLAAVLARGHVLIEDVPGVGKTTLARAMAKVLGNSFARIQFTADMLPSDVLGVQVLEPKSGTFVFRRGPLFAQIVLADEINRASPKTQSAMLEAMAEAKVTIDEVTYALPAPFTVIATQNPAEHHGAYPLPESQLDRFALRLTLGYPAAHEERALLLAPHAPERALAELPPLLAPDTVLELQRAIDDVELSEPVADYLLALVAATRDHPDIVVGCSPRGTLVLGAMARAWAFIDGRDHVLPDDIQTLAPAVLSHRLLVQGGHLGRQRHEALVAELLGQVPVPR